MSRSDNSSKGHKAYPHRGRGFRVNYRLPRTRAARRAARLALASGEEPVLIRAGHRHSALWDRF
jgi:hypothetical protein